MRVRISQPEDNVLLVQESFGVRTAGTEQLRRQQVIPRGTGSLVPVPVL